MELKPIRIEHIKCGEPQWWTLAFYPADWDKATVAAKVTAAHRAYGMVLDERAKTRKEAAPPNPGHQHVRLEDHVGKTVDEVIAERQAQADIYKAWEAKQDTFLRPFRAYLADEGFTLLADLADRALKASLDWGHRHGQPLELEDYHSLIHKDLPGPAGRPEQDTIYYVEGEPPPFDEDL